MVVHLSTRGAEADADTLRTAQTYINVHEREREREEREKNNNLERCRTVPSETGKAFSSC